ncbi:hypothetical protein IEQ34_014068 [Dendrobium chrysotoxum]|uniref:3-ketoacyl-CoA synthase n=1 Tax=Dendrobium chrysotoxum TaxID=161865 RepID=A0AAV7GI76_DENCH|nr:hypothetical protein IEQ34_014068 [Dendrobium chrysotoxum]
MERLHKHHFLSSLLHLLQLLTLYFCLLVEICILLCQCNPSYHLLPLAFILLLLLLSRRPHVYLLDFSCLRPPPNFRVPTAGLIEHLSLINCFDDQSVAFMSKIIVSSGMGEETCFPPPLHFIPPRTALADSLDEARNLLFPTLDDLFSKTRVLPSEIDALVVNCSGFCPVPSLSAMVVNHYSMREDVKSFSLSGMGCSAGAIGVDLAQGVLRARGGSARYAIVVSTEIVSTGWYAGKDRRKLLLNCFFRMGCAAVLLTNRNEEKARAKYKLIHLLRTQRAFDDLAYRSAMREEDADGITGFSIERDLLRVAAETLKANAAALGAKILPVRERLRYVWRKVRVVDWRKVISHFCLPASGRTVTEEIGKGLGIGEREMEAARMTFHRFGNQSSASMWYQLAYVEAKDRVQKGERVWQLGMGSGPKCNTMVWESLRRQVGEKEKGPWSSSIACYPVNCGGGGAAGALDS